MSAIAAILIGVVAAAWIIAAHERRYRPRRLVKRGYLETYERRR